MIGYQKHLDDKNHDHTNKVAENLNAEEPNGGGQKGDTSNTFNQVKETAQTTEECIANNGKDCAVEDNTAPTSQPTDIPGVTIEGDEIVIDHLFGQARIPAGL